MTDNVAVLQGYTEEVHLVADGGRELFLLVKPSTDLDDAFKAWCTDGQEFIRVNGWLWGNA